MFNSELFFSHASPIPDGTPDKLRAEILSFYDTYASHVMVHMLDGQTITHGLNDSPAGMLAWLLQRWKKWSDKNGDFAAAFPRDHILTNATIYNPVYAKAHENGGHFVPWENPDAFIDDVRAAFRKLR
jgi:pimeloyl-ACP methyl ester carboxylesterase